MAAGRGNPYRTTPAAATQPESATIEPTDKSIPPKIITIVIPQAKYRFVDICRKTLNIFCDFRKALDVTGFKAKNAYSTIKAIIIPIFSLK
jgi:hypothetical protein